MMILGINQTRKKNLMQVVVREQMNLKKKYKIICELIKNIVIQKQIRTLFV